MTKVMTKMNVQEKCKSCKSMHIILVPFPKKDHSTKSEFVRLVGPYSTQSWTNKKNEDGMLIQDMKHLVHIVSSEE